MNTPNEIPWFFSHVFPWLCNAVVGVITIALCGNSTSCFGEQSKPNVIVILADDLGIVDVNAFAAKFTVQQAAAMYYETPNLDRLVREGTAFSQAYSCQLCSPTRASLLTGKYASRIGITTAVGGTSSCSSSKSWRRRLAASTPIQSRKLDHRARVIPER